VCCDNKQPQCSRCISKAVECHYPAKASERKVPNLGSGESTLIETRNGAAQLGKEFPYLGTSEESRNDVDHVLHNAVLSSRPEPEALSVDFMNWGEADIDLADFLNVQPAGKNTECRSLQPSPFSRHSLPSIEQESQSWPSFPATNMSIPIAPSINIRTLLQRPRLKTAPHKTTMLILHTLRSYPLMMLRTQTLPPFIHPRLLSSNMEENQLEPLNNCMSLMNMISTRVPGSRKLFWRNVRFECEHLLQEVCWRPTGVPNSNPPELM